MSIISASDRRRTGARGTSICQFWMSGAFAQKKLADVLYKEHGLRISLSFHLKRFGGNLRYCMKAGKKQSTDLDLQPAKFPVNLCLKEELESAVHPGEAPKKESKKRSPIIKAF